MPSRTKGRHIHAQIELEKRMEKNSNKKKPELNSEVEAVVKILVYLVSHGKKERNPLTQNDKIPWF